MRYETATAFRMALEQRMKTEAERTGFNLARLRKRVAFELFLRRLAQVAPDRWVLKGALALDFRLGGASRSTKDIDLGRDDDEEAAIEDIAAAQRLRLDDFFTFTASRTNAFDEVDEFQAIRFHIRAELAERVFEQFIVDIGFSKSASSEPDRVRTSDFLSFAGIEPLELPAIPLAQHLAEKIHAYTRSYGTAGRPSTRPKDLIDILLIADSQTLEAAAVREALEHAFETRARQALPESLPAPPPEWAPDYARLAEEVGLDPDLAAAFERAATFLDPVLSGETQGELGCSSQHVGRVKLWAMFRRREEEFMRRVALLACLLVGASSCSILAQADASKLQTVRTCPNVVTKKITGRDVEVSAGFGCSGARKVIRKYFHLVIDTGQTVGGCAQKRSTKGCKVMRYRCFTKYVYAASELQGHCKGPKGIVRFIEIDRGPN